MNKKNNALIISLVLLVVLIISLVIYNFSKKGTYSIDNDPSISLSCTPSKVSKLGEIDCNVVLNTASKIILGIKANYVKNDAIEYTDSSFSDVTECNATNCFELITQTENGFASGNTEGVNGNNIIIGTIKVKTTNNAVIGNSYEIGINNIELCTDEYGVIEINNDITSSIKIANNDATLKSIVLSTGTLSPEFSKETTNYNVTVPYSVTKISVTGEVNVNTTTVIGNVTDKSLIVGENTITINTTAEDNTTKKTYTITVTREKGVATLTCNNKTYNGEEQTACTCNGGEVSGDYKSTDVGTYTASCTPDTNHTAPTNKTWTMSKKAITITAKNQTITSGESIDNSVSQVVSSELIQGHMITSITLTENNDKINVSAAIIKDSSNNNVTNNYNITYSSGTLTVTGNDPEQSEYFDIITFKKIDSPQVIYRINPSTSFSSFKSHINTNLTDDKIKVYDFNSNIIDANQTLKTGYILKIQLSDGPLEYKLSILGDVLGEGKVTLNGVKTASRHIIGSNLITNKESFLAADIDDNNEIKINDITRMLKLISD